MKKSTILVSFVLFFLNTYAQNNCQCSEKFIENDDYKSSLEIGDGLATDIDEVCENLKMEKNKEQTRKKLDDLRYAMDLSSKKETDFPLFDAFDKEYKRLKECFGVTIWNTAPARPERGAELKIVPQTEIAHVDKDIELSQDQKDEVETLAMSKTTDFNNNLTLLMVGKLNGKLLTEPKVKEIMRSTISLFSAPSCNIEISNVALGKEVKNKKRIGVYLNNIYYASKKYEVQVEHSDYVVLPNSFYKINNNYYCTVSYKQMFKKFKDGRLVYADKTTKNITVKFNIYAVTDSTGEVTNSINLFLQNASVKETQKLKE